MPGDRPAGAYISRPQEPGAVGSGGARRAAQGGYSSGLRRQLQLLWRTPDLDRFAPRGHRGRPLHRGAADGGHRNPGGAARKEAVHHRRRWRRCPAVGPGQPPVHRRATERVMAGRHHLRVHLGGMAVCQLHLRRLLEDDRRLADRQPHAHRLGPRRPGNGNLPPRRDRPADPSFRRRLAIYSHPLQRPPSRRRYRRLYRHCR
jgi:hypothetical protein